MRKYTGSCTNRIQTENDQTRTLENEIFSCLVFIGTRTRSPITLTSTWGQGGARLGVREQRGRPAKLPGQWSRQGPWGKVTQRLLARLSQLRIQKAFLHQVLKRPFLSWPCIYEAGRSCCSIGPRMGWHRPSLRKRDANHWVRVNQCKPSIQGTSLSVLRHLAKQMPSQR